MWPYGYAAYPQYADSRRCVTFWAFGRLFDQPMLGQ